VRYRLPGKEKLLSLVYPELTLAAARSKRDDARKLVAADIDPSRTKNNKRKSFILVAFPW